MVAAGPEDETRPSVSGTRIAYLRGGDIFLYDAVNDATVQITHDVTVQSRVVLDGQHLFYGDDSSGNVDIYLYDLIDGQTYKLTDHASDQILTDADGGSVVFYDSRLSGLDVWRVRFTLNHAPIANAGTDQNVVMGDLVQLAGTGVDPDGDPITSFIWSFSARPAGSGATLSNEQSPSPTFVADVAGTYVLSLLVYDGRDSSLASSVTISAAVNVGVESWVPLAFAFYPGGPNPSRDPVAFQFDLPVPTDVRFEIFDLQGRSLRRLESNYRPGRHEWTWDLRRDGGGRVDASVYLVRFSAGPLTARNKIVVLP
jgi:hypothetical protein